MACDSDVSTYMVVWRAAFIVSTASHCCNCFTATPCKSRALDRMPGSYTIHCDLWPAKDSKRSSRWGISKRAESRVDSGSVGSVGSVEVGSAFGVQVKT